VFWGEGVLVYTVDATIPGGSAPVVMIPKIESSSADYGYLYEAPYSVGDVKHVEESSASLTVIVLQQFGSSYNVKLDYQRQ
jgi:hypothetical protein